MRSPYFILKDSTLKASIKALSIQRSGRSTSFSQRVVFAARRFHSALLSQRVVLLRVVFAARRFCGASFSRRVDFAARRFRGASPDASAVFLHLDSQRAIIQNGQFTRGNNAAASIVPSQAPRISIANPSFKCLSIPLRCAGSVMATGACWDSGGRGRRK